MKNEIQTFLQFSDRNGANVKSRVTIEMNTTTTSTHQQIRNNRFNHIND